jgi:hypothetical protein
VIVGKGVQKSTAFNSEWRVSLTGLPEASSLAKDDVSDETRGGDRKAIRAGSVETSVVSAAHKSNKSNPGSYLRYLIARDAGFVA